MMILAAFLSHALVTVCSVVMSNQLSNRAFLNSVYLLCKELVTYYDKNKNKKINEIVQTFTERIGHMKYNIQTIGR